MTCILFIESEKKIHIKSKRKQIMANEIKIRTENRKQIYNKRMM